MAEAKTREAWNHTAAMLALFANIHRDPAKGVVFTPADFHPLENRKPKQVIPKDGIEALKIFLPH